jgi:predicted metal-binding membrane protein
MIMLTLGMMNPLVMVAIALVIAAEKLLPRPELIARLLGVAAIVAGLTVIA